MDEKYYLFDLLASEKNMGVNMATAINEASCDYLYKKYMTMYKEVSEMQKDLFNYAYSSNFYTLEEADSKKCQTEVDKMESEMNNSI